MAANMMNGNQQKCEVESMVAMEIIDEVIGKSMKLMDIICEVNQEICDGYCKYPNMPVPEGKDEDWLINDEDSPCISCPFNKLFKAAD